MEYHIYIWVVIINTPHKRQYSIMHGNSHEDKDTIQYGYMIKESSTSQQIMYSHKKNRVRIGPEFESNW